MVDQSFPARLRLQSNLDFQRVFRRKRSVSDSWMVLYACENNRPYSRLGLTVSGRYGNAVARNRWKRLVREVFRQQRHALPIGLDVVALPRVGRPLRYDQLEHHFPQLVARAAKKLSPR